MKIFRDKIEDAGELFQQQCNDQQQENNGNNGDGQGEETTDALQVIGGGRGTTYQWSGTLPITIATFDVCNCTKNFLISIH